MIGHPFEAGNTAGVRHGAFSERQIRPLARGHRRAMLRRFDIRSSELSPIAKATLEHYRRVSAKIVVLDEWFSDNGLVRDDGTPQPVLSLYVSLANTAVKTLGRLAEGLPVDEPDPMQALRELRERAA